MKSIFFLFVYTMLVSTGTFAQRIVLPTDSFIIHGKVAREVVITLATLDAFSKVMIEDQIIHNQKGEPKDTVTNLKGILICLLYTSPSPRDRTRSRMPSSA